MPRKSQPPCQFIWGKLKQKKMIKKARPSCSIIKKIMESSNKQSLTCQGLYHMLPRLLYDHDQLSKHKCLVVQSYLYNKKSYICSRRIPHSRLYRVSRYSQNGPQYAEMRPTFRYQCLSFIWDGIITIGLTLPLFVAHYIWGMWRTIRVF